jgi:hypothetical protein
VSFVASCKSFPDDGRPSLYRCVTGSQVAETVGEPSGVQVGSRKPDQVYPLSSRWVETLAVEQHHHIMPG